jgi:hypothetical protein
VEKKVDADFGIGFAYSEKKNDSDLFIYFGNRKSSVLDSAEL